MTLSSAASADDADVDTRTRLLDAAIHIASTQGIDKVTYRSVGRQAGLSHSLVRFYFGTGDEMIAQALERAARLDVEESRIRTDRIEDFGSAILEVASGERSRGMLQYDYLLRAVRGRGVPLERVVAVYDVYVDQVAAALVDIGVDDTDGGTAAFIMAALDGLILQHSIYGSAERTERVLERIQQVLRLLRDTADDD